MSIGDFIDTSGNTSLWNQWPAAQPFVITPNTSPFDGFSEQYSPYQYPATAPGVAPQTYGPVPATPTESSRIIELEREIRDLKLKLGGLTLELELLKLALEKLVHPPASPVPTERNIQPDL